MSAVIDQVQARLAQLKQEYMTGQGQLRELAQQEATLRETMLRISGAIQVLEELVSSNAQAADLELDGAGRNDDVAGSGSQSQPEVLTVP